MANTKGAANFRNPASSGKLSFLPPKSPFPTMPVSYSDYGTIGSKGIPKPREGQRHHQRTSSESFLIEEQPSWLDDLLNEPEIPVKRGAHRRSTSDSFAYLDGANIYANLPQEEGRKLGITSQTSWRGQDFDGLKDVQHAPYAEANLLRRPRNRGWDALNMVSHLSGAPLAKDRTVHLGSTCVLREGDAVTSNVIEKKEQEQYSSQDSKSTFERKEGSHAKQFDADPKRAKQQFAQRSRVRKLQYIAELERNVQALQAEGMEFSAELEFLNQQNLILNLENKTLKQQLDSLAQEHLIKRVQQEMLDREIARLRSLYQQQQQQLQQPPAPTHGRSSSRDLDSQFANLSLKHKDPNSGRDLVTGPLHI